MAEEEIVRKYFAPEHIESVKNFNGRLIVTLKGISEQAGAAEALKAELAALDGIKKVSIVFTQNVNTAGVAPEIENGKLKALKKLSG